MPSSDNRLTASQLLIPSLLFLIKTKSIINLSGHKHYITNISPTANYWICSVKGISQLKHFWDPLLWLRFCSDNISCRKKTQLSVPECTVVYKKIKSIQNILFIHKENKQLYYGNDLKYTVSFPSPFLGRQISLLSSGLMRLLFHINLKMLFLVFLEDR